MYSQYEFALLRRYLLPEDGGALGMLFTFVVMCLMTVKGAVEKIKRQVKWIKENAEKQKVHIYMNNMYVKYSYRAKV